MKKIVLAFFFAAIPFIFACTKSELGQTESNLKLVQRTFSATLDAEPAVAPSSKGELGTDGKTMQWTAGDAIAVYDDVNPDVAHKFTAQSSGPSTTFTGSVSDGATSFYAVYPYDACMKHDEDNERFTVTIPHIQNAVEGSFDPRGVIAGAYLTDDSGDASGFNFKLINGLLKFSVDYDDVLAVTFSNTARNMSGNFTFDIKADEAGAIKNVGESNLASEDLADRWKDVTIRNADGTPLKRGSVYYVACKQSSFNSPYREAKVSLFRGTPKYAVKTYKDSLVVARRAIRNFGTFSGLNSVTDRYQYYQDGYDIVIGGKVFNKAKFGDAQLKTPADNSKNIRSYLYNETDKVTFLAPGTYTCGSVTAVANVAVVAQGDDDVVVTVNNAWNMNSGSIAVYGLKLNLVSSINMSSNTQNATADAEYLIFDHCFINGLCKSFWTPNSKGTGKDYTVKEFLVTDCVIGIGATGQSFFNINSCNYKENCKKATFTNNVMYATTGATFTLNLLNCDNGEAACTGGGAAVTATVLDIDVQNNLFVNMVSGNLIKYNRPKSLILKNNVEWDTNNSDVLGTTTKAKLFKVYSTEGTVAELSGCYAHGLTDGYTFTYSDNSADALMQSLGITDSGLPDAAPLFSTAPAVADGKVTYTLASGYEFIGPQ